MIRPHEYVKQEPGHGLGILMKILLRTIVKDILMLSTVAFFCISCAPAGLHKTSFEKWKEKKYDYMGLAIDVPAKSSFYCNDEGSPADKRLGFRELDFFFHPIGSGALLDEPRYLITVRIVRVAGVRTNEYMNGGSFLFKGYNAFAENIRTNIPIFYTNTTKRIVKITGYGTRQGEGKDDFSVTIRRDIICTNGDLLLCGSSIFAGEDEFVDPTNDTAAIIHMIDSVAESPRLETRGRSR